MPSGTRIEESSLFSGEIYMFSVCPHKAEIPRAEYNAELHSDSLFLIYAALNIHWCSFMQCGHVSTVAEALH